MKSLIKLSVCLFFLASVWAWTDWVSAEVKVLSWEEVATFSDVPQNQQVQLPAGVGVHPLSLSSKVNGDEIDSYRYIYVSEADRSKWEAAIEEYQTGNQDALRSLLAAQKSVLLVDTLKYRGKATTETPQTVLPESEVVGYCHQGAKYLNGNQQEFGQLFSHIPAEKWVVLVENPATKPKQTVPFLPLGVALGSLVLAVGLAIVRARSEG